MLRAEQPFRGFGLAKLMIDEAFKLTETLGIGKWGRFSDVSQNKPGDSYID